ncbi:signal recognition particle protein [Candidatus Pacearchaeota archaeon]|nr:signal recognition particle protein [Candidatus Pacearchaeota archaeon]
MLGKLSETLRKITDKVANAIFLDKNLVESIVKELQRAMIEADINISLVGEISQEIRKAAFDERIKGIEKKEHIIKLLHDELLRILGKKKEIHLGKKEIFILVGLYGSGKTTTAGKLAFYYSKRGRKVCCVGLDVHRPAAAEQLKQVCEKINIKCFIESKEKNSLKIWKNFEKEIKQYDLVIVDTAGRDALDDPLIEEIKNLGKAVKPTESFLVIPADIGQAAKKQARAFKEALRISGVIITRMDSSAKGGGALTAAAEAEAQVAFIGTGEKMNELESFDPESFLSRLLGMGDLKALMERIHSVMNEKEAERQKKKLEERKFTLRDLQGQLDSMQEIGSFDKIMLMIPGLGKLQDKIPTNELEGQQERVKRWKHIINSMTEEEIENPDILEKQTSRIQRIAKGSGATSTDVRMLLKQYKMLNEMIKSQAEMQEGKIDQKMIMKMARKFGKKLRF